MKNITAYRYKTVSVAVDETTDFLSVLRPDGREEKAFSFVRKPVRIEYDEEGFEQILPEGKTLFCCRYTPDFEGEATVSVHDKSGKIVRTFSLTVFPSEEHGYAEVGKEDPRYLVLSDGTPFPVVGVNLAYPTEYRLSAKQEFALSGKYGYLGLRQYERWFRALSQNGVNLVRLWLGHEYFSPDTEKADVFRYEQFEKLDAILALAEKYSLRLKLTFEQFRFFDYEKEALSDSYADDVFRKFNKRLYLDGVRCENSKMWLTDEKFRATWLEKVREYANRIGGNPTVAIVEPWNEMNCVGSDFEDVLVWNRTMLPELKKLFPKQLVTNSLGSLDSEYSEAHYRTFCWDKTDLSEIHRYLDCGAPYADCRGDMQNVSRTAKEHVDLPSDRPFLIAETGAVNDCHSGPFRYYMNDHRGILFVDAVYTPLFCGSCGTGNLWHWNEQYLEAKNLYPLYAPIAKLFAGINIEQEHFCPRDLSDDAVSLLVLEGKNTLLGFVRNRADNWKNVLRDLAEPQPIPAFSAKLSEAPLSDLRVFPIFEGETAKADLSDKTLSLSDLRFGLLFSCVKK